MSPDQEMDEANDPEILRERIAALEKERDRTLTDWREYKASKDADVAAWKTKADATADERDAALADNAALLHLVRVAAGDRGLLASCWACGHNVAHSYACRFGAALERSHPGAALLGKHRKALVRARNEGLEAAAVFMEAEEEKHRSAKRKMDLSTKAGHRGFILAEERETVCGVAADDIRAMKEPES